MITLTVNKSLNHCHVISLILSRCQFITVTKSAVQWHCWLLRQEGHLTRMTWWCWWS